MAELSRGSRLELAPGSLDLEVLARGTRGELWRAALLFLDESDHAVVGAEFVSSERRAAPSGAATHSERSDGTTAFHLDLARLAAAQRVVLVMWAPESVVTAHGSTAISDGGIRILQSGRAIGEVSLRGDHAGTEAAVTALEVYHRRQWRLMVNGGGFVGGLRVMLSHYKMPTAAADVLLGTPPRSGGARPATPPPGAEDGDSTDAEVRLPRAWAGAIEPRLPAGLVSAVGLVVSIRDGSDVGSGSGFAISPGGHVITCAHVVKDSHVAFMPHGSKEIRALEVLLVDENLDVAVCRLVDGGGCENWLLLSPPADAVELGTEVGLIGYPLGFSLAGGEEVEPSLSLGIVNSVRTQSNRLQIDAGAAPGSSGSPVFRRRDGRVVGVLVGGIEKHRGGMLINFACDMRAVWSLGWFRT